MTASALYSGIVWHRRLAAPTRDLRHPVSFLYLDLDELPQLLGGRLVRRRPGVVRVRRRDLLGGDEASPGDVCEHVRALISEQSGRPAVPGPIRVLTHPRVLGVCFNPVSFYYAFDERERLDAVVAEVTNTPWGERHAYVLRRDPEAADDGDELRGAHRKALHVSPFQPMERRHEWAAEAPGATLAVRIVNRPAGAAPADFEASLALRREPLTAQTLRTLLTRRRAGALRVLALIYGHGLALRVRGAARFAHAGRS